MDDAWSKVPISLNVACAECTLECAKGGMKMLERACRVVVLLAFVILGTALACGGQAALAEGARYKSHHDLLVYVAANGQIRPIRSAADWNVRRLHILEGMQEAMGKLPRPTPPVDLDVRTLEQRTEAGIEWRKLSYCTDRADKRVHAWLLVPKSETNAPQPAVLCLHQTTPAGKDSPVGLAGRPTLHYAIELARRGYVTLSPDYPSFGEHSHDFEKDDYESGSMKAIYDNLRAVDLLTSLPEVDKSRIGCIGHSLGGHNSLFTAAFDERIKVVVTSCGFTRFSRYMGGDLTGWTSSRYMPRIAARFGKSPDAMPFDFAEVVAVIAPRAVFIVAPLHDDNFDVAGVKEVIEQARPVFRLLGSEDKLQVVYPDAGHDFPDRERKAAYEFIDTQLRANRSE